MTQRLTLERLGEIAQEVTGNAQIVLRSDQSTTQIPGWDSLNHTIILMRVSAEHQVEIEAADTAGCRNFGELVDLVNQRIDRLGDAFRI